MYLTYDEYKEYGGALDESTFNSLIFDAQIEIDYRTFYRLEDDTVIPIKVKMCVAKIIDLLNTFTKYKKVVTNVDAPVIESQSNDGVSVKYGGYLGNTNPTDIDNISKKLNTDITNVIKRYLTGEKNQSGEVLLYRGVYR